jgi:hypothetical protein
VIRAPIVGGAVCAALLLAVLSLLIGVEKSSVAASPDYRLVTAGGIEYEAMLGRPIDPKNAVDRNIIAGLPARDRQLRRGQMLFGAFISITNPSSQRLPSADRIVLRDDGGHVYPALPLPPGNPYAYSPRIVGARTRIPAQGSPADVNLAATGRLVLFRIPADKYTAGGTLELVIHDPAHPGRTASLIV